MGFCGLQASDRLYYVFQTLQDAKDALAGDEVPLASEEHIASSALLATVEASLCDDLNTPQAIAALSEPLKTLNDLLHTKKVGNSSSQLEGADREMLVTAMMSMIYFPLVGATLL